MKRFPIQRSNGGRLFMVLPNRSLKTLTRSNLIPEDNRGMKRWNFYVICSLRVLKLSNRSKKKSRLPDLPGRQYGVLLMNSKSSSARWVVPKRNHIGSGVCQKNPLAFLLSEGAHPGRRCSQI